MVAVIVVILLFAGMFLLILFRVWSPGRPTAVRDDDAGLVPGAVSEKTRVEINGIEQGMFIRGRRPSNPVLLFLHGGPGMPEYFLDRTHPTGLEQVFTVCWWEQRGAGLSYRAARSATPITVEQLINDTLAVTDYLRHRFDVPKIYLMGRSWGSFIGNHAAARAPQRYHAYIGVGQICRQLPSEAEAYAYLVEELPRRGHTRLARKLAAAPPPTAVPLSKAYLRLRDPAMHQLGVGTTRDMRSAVTGVFLQVWRTPAYTIHEKINLWRGKWSPWSTALWNEMLAADLVTTIPRLQVPVHLFHGRHDRTCSYLQAKAYCDQLVAPVKGFYTFPNSAHSPVFEEPAHSRFLLLTDVLHATAEHSDTGTMTPTN